MKHEIIKSKPRLLRKILSLLTKIIETLLLLLILLYQYFISPFFGKCCRFSPSCSEYGKQAIVKWGVLRGGKLLFKRVLKCHPGHPGGQDLIP